MMSEAARRAIRRLGNPERWRLVVLSTLACAVLAVSFGPQPVLAQALETPESAQPATAVPPPAEPGFYVGVAACGQDFCHGSTRPRDTFPVLQNELYTWRRRDPHSRAFETLKSSDSRRIVTNLGLSRPATETASCLACHALVVPPERTRRRLDLADGITCESCHGPASGWRGEHTAADWSRDRSVAQGMIDLADPTVRAATCLSCHLGDDERTVDHELLAAGHPLLTFELDNYSAGMPPHWRAWNSKPAEARPERTSHGARAWAVGQAVAFREAMARVRRSAQGGPWPDFASLDCTSCHHDLREDRWRRGDRDRSRDRRSGLGLPPWSPARWAVLRHILAEAHQSADSAASADSDDSNAGPESMKTALARRQAIERSLPSLARQLSSLSAPRSQVAATAASLESDIGELIPVLDEMRWDEARLRSLLTRIARDRDWLAGADHRSHEQVLLAINSLSSELLALRRDLVSGELVTVIEAMNRALDGRFEVDQERFGKLLERLEAALR